MSKAEQAPKTTEYELVVLMHSVPSRRGSTTLAFNSGPPDRRDGGFRITKDALGWVHIEDTTGVVEHIEVPPSNVREMRRKM